MKIVGKAVRTHPDVQSISLTDLQKHNQSSMTKDEILLALQKEVEGYNKIIATENGDWIVKGFIDIYKNIYTITIDH